MSLPESLEESARIDGANDTFILFKIVLPLSKAILATIALWYGIGQWNAWFDCLLYMDKEKNFVLQLVLRRILLDGQQLDGSIDTSGAVNPDNMKMAALMIATVPILCIYPFLQKYFVKGVMVGSLKG
jgi:putative aldouronate transport system permease protein